MSLPLRLALPLALGLLAMGLTRSAAAEPDPAAADEETLRAAEMPTDGPGLLEFFHRRTLMDTDRLRVQKLIRDLGDESFDVREQASGELKAMGAAVRPMLRDALRDADPEVRFRAQRCLAAIDQGGRPTTLVAALRTLARLKPAGAAEALLAALPTLEDPEVVDEVCRALAATGVRMGRVDPALLQALGDPSPARRAAAGEALARAGGADLRPAVEKLLEDSDPSVRQRVALALLEAHDKEAIPTLIALLGDLPRERSGAVEEALQLAAGEQAPSLSPGDDEESRGKCRDAWEDWWKDHGAALDLAKIDFSTHHLGYTLVAEMDLKTTASRLVEYDADGAERWEMDGLRYVIDAEMVGTDRVLVAEYLTRTVTERNLRGEVVWQYKANAPLLGARRTADGDTFVVTRNRLDVVDKDGRVVSSIVRPNDVCTAARFRDGTIALLTNGGLVIHLDGSGKELKATALNAGVMPIGANIEALPNGHVLLPIYSSNKVVELDEDGKTVWEAATRQPTSVSRLPNGRTLVASRLARTVVELDHDGNVVRSWTVEGRPFRATQR